MNVFISRNCR